MSETRKVQKLYNIDLKSVDEANRRITFCFSDDQPDRDGEIVDQASWDVTNYKVNPVILWGHDPSDNANVLGQGVSLELNTAGKSFITAQFDDADTNPKADTIFRQLIKRTLRTVSAGFISHTFEMQDDTPVLKDNELLEVSIVAIPSNPRAIARAFKSGEISRKDAQWMRESMLKEAEALDEQLKEKTEEESSHMDKELSEALLSGITKLGEAVDRLNGRMEAIETKMVDDMETKGSTSLPLAPEDRKWDAGAAIKNIKAWASNSDGEIDFKKYGKAFFAGSGDKQGDYKLPFADVIDGKLTAVWDGVKAAYGAVEGARGGVEGVDKNAVLAQIKKYYKRFGKDMPEKAVDLEEVETKDVDLTDTKTKDADADADKATEDTEVKPDTQTDETKADDTKTEQEDETKSTDDVAKDGGNDQSGATTEEIDGDAELTPELQAEIDRSLESAMAA